MKAKRDNQVDKTVITFNVSCRDPNEMSSLRQSASSWADALAMNNNVDEDLLLPSIRRQNILSVSYSALNKLAIKYELI